MIGISVISVAPYLTSGGSKKEALEESVEICNQALKNLAVSKNIYYGFGGLCLILLIGSLGFDFQDSLTYLLGFVRVLLLIFIFFSVFMSKWLSMCMMDNSENFSVIGDM